MGTGINYIDSVYHNLDDLVFSFLIVLITVFICDLARELLLYGGRLNLDDHSRFGVAEVIGTMEATVICFEINFIIYDVFGIFMYMLATFILVIWQTNRPPQYQYEANPLHVMVKHIQAIRDEEVEIREDSNKNDRTKRLYKKFEFIMTMICAEGVGAYLAYNFMLHVAWNNASYWKFWKETNYHVTRFETANSWTSSMSEGPVLAGIAEGVFSFAQYLWPMYINFRRLQGNTAIVATGFGPAAFAGLGAHYSGGYYNPMYGSALEITTHGYSTLAKVIVYWVAPVTGTLLAMIIGDLS